MKINYPLLIITSVLILAVGCTKNTTKKVVIPKDAAKMGVTFSWEGIGPCSHVSPEIQVSNIPDGTRVLRINLKNNTVPTWNQGGGILEHDGSGLIPAGALDIGYNGPCPPLGKRYRYEFSVMAVNAEEVIVGFGKTGLSFPPKN